VTAHEDIGEKVFFRVLNQFDGVLSSTSTHGFAAASYARRPASGAANCGDFIMVIDDPSGLDEALAKSVCAGGDIDSNNIVTR
jgi:hypothetical protein